MLDSGYTQRRLYSPTRSNARWTDSLRCRRHFLMCNVGNARDEPPGLHHGGDLSRNRGRDGPRSRHGKSARFLACRGEQAGGGLYLAVLFLLVYRGCVRTHPSHSTCGIGFTASYCSFRSCTTPRYPCFQHNSGVFIATWTALRSTYSIPQCGSVPSYACV